MSADGSAPIFLPLQGKTIRAADLFCGAGGTSTGARRAITQLGGTMKLVAVNHWQTAIDTHTRMHPDAQHLCADLEHVRPRQAVPAGVLDLLMASPTCTYYSRARGGRPVNDQQRMDPWHVVRWCTELRVHRLLVENVPEMMDWGPCNAQTGKPIASRKGEYFRAWIAAIEAIGFRVDYRVLCCADYGDPTTRERFFLIGRSDRKPLRWPEPSHARAAGTDLLSTRARWRGAVEIIDWGRQGKSIFTRKKPLRPNTIRRILAGAIRYHWPQPYVDSLRALLGGCDPILDVRAEHAWKHAAGAAHVGLVMATGAGGVARDLAQPVPTVTAGGDGGARPHYITPLLLPVGNDSADRGLPISKHGGPGNTARSVADPLFTVDTGGAGAVAQPLLAPYYGGGSGLTSQPVTEPVPAVTTKARFGVAEPFLVPNFGEREGQVPRTHDIEDPVPTITAQGHIQLAQPAAEGYRIDILYRMLHWRELAGAMSFDDEGEVYDFAGTATDITKQIGNAVPGRTAKALVRALLEAG